MGQNFLNIIENRLKTLSWITVLTLLGDPEVTANLYCNFAYPYWEGCVICSIYLQNFWVTQYDRRSNKSGCALCISDSNARFDYV